jgi:hypothetical protein
LVYPNKYTDFSVDEKQQQVISSKVSAEEAEVIKGRAAVQGISVSEYIRQRALSQPTEASNDRLEALVKHGIYITNQVYVALYLIAETEGKAGQFLTAKQLDEVHDRVRAAALDYAVEFPNSFAAVQAEIAAMNKKDKA